MKDLMMNDRFRLLLLPLLWLSAAALAFGCSTDAKKADGDGPGCPSEYSLCSTPTQDQCVNLQLDAKNCGSCGQQCGAGQVCSAGQCACPVGKELCGDTCVDIAIDPNNCGVCGKSCAAEGASFCSSGACTNECGAPNSICASGATALCVDLQSSVDNCGGCGKTCGGAQSCSAGSCACADGSPACGAECCGAGQECNAAGTACVAVSANGGAGGGGGGNGGGGMSNGGMSNGGAAPKPVDDRECPAASDGVIVDFEEGSAAVLPLEGRQGAFEPYGDPDGTFSVAEIEEEGAEACNKGVFHAAGSGFSTYVGVGTTFASSGVVDEEYVPVQYDAKSRGYVGVAFRAKAGPQQQGPVRISLSIPSSEGEPHGDGTCGTDEGEQCWNHLGHFLIDDEALGSEWKDYTLCFDDLHTMWVPGTVQPPARAKLPEQLLKFQVQFNQGFDPATTKQYPYSQSFDFYIDDISFVKDGCPRPSPFESSPNTTQPFGSNMPVGTCMPVPNAAVHNTEIAQAYLRWKSTFVGADGTVFDPEQGNRVISEGIGYGMLLSAAMGDKELFDRIWGWAEGKMGGGLLGWDNGNSGSGSATDADTDMAYALYMADHQWGGYAAAAADLATKAAAADLDGTNLKAGSQFNAGNPSYFSPGFYRKLGGAWASVVGPGYQWMDSCDSSFGGGQNGIISDWCDFGGNAVSSSSTGANVTSETCPNSGEACSAYDASRIPWRVGYDLCFNAQGAALAARMVQTYQDRFQRLDLAQAGISPSGSPYEDLQGSEMAVIGSLAVAAWATNNVAARDVAFYATLDILQRPEYYKTYYSTTLGLLTMTLMTGNWPAP